MTAPSPSIRLRSLPDVRFLMPGIVVPSAFAAVATVLCVLRLPSGFWLIAALAGIALAAVVPKSLAAWLLLTGIGIDTAVGVPVAPGIEAVGLIAGVHLLHVLGAQMLVVPVRSLVQASVLLRPLLRFVAIQVPVQAVAWVALVAFSPDSETAVPVVGVAGAVAAVVLSALLAVPLLRERERG